MKHTGVDRSRPLKAEKEESEMEKRKEKREKLMEKEKGGETERGREKEREREGERERSVERKQGCVLRTVWAFWRAKAAVLMTVVVSGDVYSD
jgi:hypothetical protein